MFSSKTSSNSTQQPEPRPILSTIVDRFQITVPAEVRKLYGLEVGDIFEWTFDPQKCSLVLIPKRAQLLDAQIDQNLTDLKNDYARGKTIGRVVNEQSRKADD